MKKNKVKAKIKYPIKIDVYPSDTGYIAEIWIDGKIDHVHGTGYSDAVLKALDVLKDKGIQGTLEVINPFREPQ